MFVAQAILGVVLTYGAVGLLFGLVFVTLGVTKVDPAAHGTSVLFRLLIFPGVVAFWPLLAGKWMTVYKRGVSL